MGFENVRLIFQGVSGDSERFGGIEERSRDSRMRGGCSTVLQGPSGGLQGRFRDVLGV